MSSIARITQKSVLKPPKPKPPSFGPPFQQILDPPLEWGRYILLQSVAEFRSWNELQGQNVRYIAKLWKNCNLVNSLFQRLKLPLILPLERWSAKFKNLQIIYNKGLSVVFFREKENYLNRFHLQNTVTIELEQIIVSFS